MNTAILDTIQLDPKARASINYAKAREAIQVAFPNRAEKRRAKLIVVEALHGTLIHPKASHPSRTPPPNYVQFDDHSKARF